MSNNIRWMVRRDIPEVLAIEDLAFDPADRWPEDDYIRHLRERNTIGMVVELPGEGWPPIVGVMVYRLLRDRMELLRLAVHAEHWGRGVGRRFLDRVQGKLARHRDRVTLDVPEDFLGAHLFLKACGFRATTVDRDGAGLGRDLYRFEHRLGEAVSATAYADWCGRLRKAAIDGGIAARPGWFAAFGVLLDAVAAPGCPPALPLPSIHPGDDGRVRLTWRNDGRSVHLQAGVDGAEVRLDPEAFPAWVHEASTDAECLARAFRWIFLDGPAQAPTPAPAKEDRPC